MNYWDKHMKDDATAATYMLGYDEGPGCTTRKIIFSFIKQGDSVLDVGCGPGWNLDHSRQFGPVILYKGIDYSSRFIRVANKRAREKYALTPFSLGDARHLEEADGSYDVVILQDVLEHINGYEIPVREALRVAGKRVIISFWKDLNKKGTGDDFNDDGDDGYGATYERDKWEKFLDSQPYDWTRQTTPKGANRKHIFYVIFKEKPNGHRPR